MVAGTLARYFGMRFLGAAASVFGGNPAAGRAGRLRGDDPAGQPGIERLDLHRGADLAVPRPAGHRADHPVRRADRGDDLLSDAVAAAGARGCALGGNVRLAVHYPRRDRGAADRGRRHHRLQSGVRRLARVFQAAGSRAVRATPARGTGRLLGPATRRQRPVDSQRRLQPQPGAAPRRGHRC